MSREIKLSDEAHVDVEGIWDYTAKKYDFGQAIEYTRLLDCALADIEEEPDRPTSRRHPEYGEFVRSYHVKSSRKRSGTQVREPRHVIYYTLKHDDVILVLRILKDDMDAPRHLVPD